MRGLVPLLALIGGTVCANIALAQDKLPGLIPLPFPKSTPGYDQLVDRKTKEPIEWHQIVYNQIDRICLRHGSNIPEIEKLAKAEMWTVVGVDSRLNQFVLKANGGSINRIRAWEFSVGPQRYFVAVTPQPSYSLALGAIRPNSKNVNKCEIKLVAGSIEGPIGLASVLRANHWSVIASPKSEIQIFGTASSDREITLIKDYNRGAAPIEVIVM